MSSLIIEQTFRLAIQHHQAGRLKEAEQIYRQILDKEPKHAGSLHLLGVIARREGRFDLAVELIRKAIAITPIFPEAHYNLGNALRDKGLLDDAIAAFRKAIALKPNYHEAYYNLGNVLREKGLLEESIAAYRLAIAIKPNFLEAHGNLGIALMNLGRFDEAVAALRQAIAINPNFPEPYYNLGSALWGQGNLNDAITAYRQAIALKPQYAEAHNNLGKAFMAKGMLNEGIAAFGQATLCKPYFAEAHCNLGIALRDKRQFDEAIVSCRRAIALKPDYPEAHNGLAISLRDKGQLEEAIIAFRQAIALKPNYAEAYSNLGLCLKDKGLLDEAIAAFRQAIAITPSLRETHSNLLFTMYYHPGFDAQAIAQEHRRWNQQHAEPLRWFVQPHLNDRNPDRRLRIGYVSADFKTHASAFFLVPLMENHDQKQVELFCYAQIPQADGITRRLEQHVAQLQSIVGLTDQQVAAQIREDKIDILIDLKLHTANNRLLLFAHKPAPIQITWLGFPGSTGLTTIDYRFTDPYLDPPGIDESVYSEKTLRLPHTFWCYDALDGQSVAVSPLPALTNNFITFGCLNNFCKINDAVLHLWAKVLHAVPNSRLLLLVPEGNPRDRTLELLKQDGIAPDRIEFVPRLARQKYLELHHRIDIGLDTFPYNGHTTSLDSFYMGVPVITLIGQTIVGRAGFSQLSNLNLAELAAQTPDEFLRIVTQLAGDLDRLQKIRQDLRPRMEKSPLMDAPAFARAFESAFRQTWQHWCSTNPV